MKLLSLHLKDYRVLHGFTLNLEEQRNALLQLNNTQYTLDLIVGVNGTGKSTLLRAIAEIFRRLEAETDFSFGFEIDYELMVAQQSTRILISNLSVEQQPLSEKQFRFRVGETTTFPSRIDKDYLPPLVVALTTGSEREWELQDEQIRTRVREDAVTVIPPQPDSPTFIEEQTDWFLSELPGDPIEELQETVATQDSEAVTEASQTLQTDYFLFVKEKHLPLTILCGLLVDMVNTREVQALNQQSTTNTPSSSLRKVLEACNIKALHGFSLKFRMNRDVLSTSDQTFIHDLDMLCDYHSIQTGSDYLLVFNLAELHPEDLIKIRGTGLELFRTLVSLFDPEDTNEPILQEVNLFLERQYNKTWRDQQNGQMVAEEQPPLHLLTWFSDGERSFLGRLCLLSLLGSGKSEALILLDEPEVHFNDYWKRQLVLMIDRALEQQNSHVLMTTHSSITLSDVLNRNIKLLRRDKAHTQYAITPTLKTLGTDPSDIMVYIFEAENAVGAQGTEIIERELRQIARYETVETQRQALQELLDQVGPSDLRFLIRRQLHALENDRR